MKVRCKHNNIAALDKKLEEYAFDQDENGDMDITINKLYDVYGIQDNNLGRFYLVQTDELNRDTPWWMPAGLYEIYDSTQPVGWVERKKNAQDSELTVYSYPIYFEAEEDIEDGTERGVEVFSKMKEYLVAE